ncbi:PDZ domain-containing protein [Candidatus Parcubacteria bacterium]|nr:MAG: PDZ domain-containing protein [Candidatus Parcubacteria bacterium]
MNGREKIQLSVIGVLLAILVVGFTTNFESFVTKAVLPEQALQITVTGAEQNGNAEPKDAVQPAIFDTETQAKKQSSQLTLMFKQVENSVVQITSKVTSVNPNVIINGNPLESQSTKLGSGFVYDTSGHIITNNHVVEGAKTVDVRFVDGNIYSANVIGTDPYNDIAVLQITDDFSEETLQPVILGDSSQLEVGQQVIAIGNPYGLSGTVTTGIVSQVGRLLPNNDAGYSIPNVIQTDAAINPGNSGGPLLDMQGHVIGINTAIQSGTGEFSGIGFAVPSNTVKRLVPSLIENGKYSHPWLGVSGTSLTPDIAKQIGLPKNYKGVFVTTVIPDGPAQKAGLQEASYNINREIKGGDVIIAMDGYQVRDIDDLIIYLADNKNVGDTVVLQVNRNNNLVELTAMLQERPAN